MELFFSDRQVNYKLAFHFSIKKERRKTENKATPATDFLNKVSFKETHTQLENDRIIAVYCSESKPIKSFLMFCCVFGRIHKSSHSSLLTYLKMRFKKEWISPS